MRFLKFLLILPLVLVTSNFFVYTSNLHVERERYCMTEALWHEARGENEAGIRAVATVILNRSQSKHYPDSICRVIRQYKQFSYTHQLKDFYPQPKQVEYRKYDLIVRIAEEISEGTFKKTLPSNVLWYHTVNVKPKWSEQMKVLKTVGKHKFLYKSTKGK
jgi:spore germination cell wall hydrolase CwlJ-like protein